VSDHPERFRVAEIAIDLFLARGYDEVTVGEIAQAAGISRRTMFRLFAAKEEIPFPDHEGRRQTQRAFLEASDPDADPLDTLAAAGERVLADFLEHRELVLKRYELTRADARVREREIVENAGYVQTIRRFLRDRADRMPAGPPGAEEPIAAMIDGAHVAVLKRWVRSGGTTDATAELREHFRWVLGMLRGAPAAADATPTAIPPSVLAVLPATEESLAFIERVRALVRDQDRP
jgi:AcrR family transcriptional regulator